MDLSLARPKVRDGVVLGPAQHRRGSMVHHVKDPLTDSYYRIGTREHFLLSRMDGRRNLEELGAEYAVAFGRRLGQENWAQIFGMLHKRQLLEGMVAPPPGSGASAAPKRTLLQASFPLLNPARLLDALAPRLAPLYTAWFVVPASLAVCVLVAFVISEFRSLTTAATSGGSLLTGVFAVIVTWSIIVLHEFAHGLTCRRFGGQVNEMGLLWRFPMLAPYCKVDDVVLLPARHRVATAFAGVFASMLTLLPFWALWALAPSGGAAQRFAGTILLFGTAAASVNLVPFLRLDGYYMLTHALNQTDLRGDSYAFFGALFRGGPAAVRAYRRGDRIAYIAYTIASAAFAVTVGTLLVRFWYDSLRGWVGPAWAVAILVAEALILAAFLSYAAHRARTRSARQPGVASNGQAD